MRAVTLAALAPLWVTGTAVAQPMPSFHNCVRNFVLQFDTNTTKATFSEISRAALSNCEGSLNSELQNERNKIYQFIKTDQNPMKSSSIEAETYLLNYKRDRQFFEMGAAISELISKKASP